MTPERIAELGRRLENRNKLIALSAAKDLLTAVESLQADNVRLRFLLNDARDGLYALDKVSPERLAAIDAALEGKP